MASFRIALAAAFVRGSIGTTECRLLFADFGITAGVEAEAEVETGAGAGADGGVATDTEA